MNILLVYPKYPDTFWSFVGVLKFISKKAAFPPLGLLTIASMLPKEWNKKLVDVNIEELTDEHINWADMVFVSAMIVQKNSAQEIINKCKAHGKTIIAGGPVFTTQHENFKNVDHFILNEAEITLPLFLKDLESNKAKLVYRSSVRPDIKKTSIPLWHLIDFKNYATMSVQYSRGCPFNCEFCDIVIMNGRQPRTKSPEQMISEFQSLYDAGWRGSVFVVDDNFIGNKVSVKKMLLLLIEWQKKYKYPFKLFTEASINLADDAELMQMMSTANFYKVFIGIETPNIKSLGECNKLQNTKRDLLESVKIIQRNGMQVMAGFIVGFDNDTDKIFESQIKFIQQTGIVTAMVGMLVALPQTRLWHRLKSENRIIGDASGENTDGFLNFIPKMGEKKLIEGYKKILSAIYSPKNYYKRINTFLENYQPIVRSKISASDIKAFIRSTWRIGIFSKANFLYWKLLLTTFFTKSKRKTIPIAIEQAILWLHFSKTAKKIN